MTTITIANAGENKKKKHDVLRRIKYRSRLKGERYINPGDEQITLDHLSDTDYLTGLKCKLYTPASAKSGGK